MSFFPSFVDAPGNSRAKRRCNVITNLPWKVRPQQSVLVAVTPNISALKEKEQRTNSLESDYSIARTDGRRQCVLASKVAASPTLSESIRSSPG
jgi:hypothetical protein